jgi:pimeloyl-ACP methyl ester carboxylesterase
MRPRLFAVCAQIALACLLAPCVARTASGQEPRPVVLVHGFFADGLSWAEAQWAFEHGMNVKTYAPTLGWERRLFRQKNDLISYMNGLQLPNNTILVAHSFGALTAREASKERAISGILTVGSPHGGAPIAESINFGLPEAYGALMSWNVASAWENYVHADANSTPWCWGSSTETYCDEQAFFTMEALINAGVIAAGTAAITSLFEANAVLHDGGSLQDIEPGSTFVDSLDSDENLAREAQTMGDRRVALLSHYTGANFRIWEVSRPSQASWITGMQVYTILQLMWSADYYANMYNEMSDPHYDEKKLNWYKLFTVGASLETLEIMWCSWTGQLELQPYSFCQEGDGLFSINAQQWPGGALNDHITGPAHTSEKASGAFHSRAQFWLQNRFGVIDIPPSSALNVSISGSFFPMSPGEYTYTATATGGTGSYSYRWQLSVDGTSFWDTAITGSQFTQYVNYNDVLWLRVIVNSGTLEAPATQVIRGPCENGGLLIC